MTTHKKSLLTVDGSCSAPKVQRIRYPTPLRYPGGKQRLGSFFAELLAVNDLCGATYAEPFAGSAGVAMHLLLTHQVRRVMLNDADRSIFAFWHSVKAANARLCRLITDTPITVQQWDLQKDVQRRKQTAPLLALGFSTLFLNRTNRSGILRAGMIGGRKQESHIRLDARYNRVAIAERIRRLRSLADKIEVCHQDAIDFIRYAEMGRTSSLLYYLDPPYFRKSNDLYLNRYTLKDHKALAKELGCRVSSPWVLTYDKSPYVKTLYPVSKVRYYKLAYSADARRTGSEVMIASPGLRVPRIRLLA